MKIKGPSTPLHDPNNPPDVSPMVPLRELLTREHEMPVLEPATLEGGWWMNARVAGDHFDLCKGSGELPDEDGKMHPCVGCLGCGGPKSGSRTKLEVLPDPTPTVFPTVEFGGDGRTPAFMPEEITSTVEQHGDPCICGCTDKK